MNAICLITLRPNNIWCNFLNSFRKYQIFIIIDDNEFDCTFLKNKYTNITFIQINNNKCKLRGYLDVNYMIKKDISGWDKALYYFGVENIHYNFKITIKLYF